VHFGLCNSYAERENVVGFLQPKYTKGSTGLNDRPICKGLGRGLEFSSSTTTAAVQLVKGIHPSTDQVAKSSEVTFGSSTVNTFAATFTYVRGSSNVN